MIRLQDASNNWKGPWLYTDQQSYSFLAKTKLHPGDILMSNVGSVGKFFLVPDLDRPMTLAPNAVLLRSMTYSTYFLFQLLQTSSMTESINEKTTPGVQQKINKTDFKKIITNVPTLNESSMVGQMLFLLDNLIAATQDSIEALGQAKKALLQHLFDQSWRFKGYSDPWEKRKLGELIDHKSGKAIEKYFDNDGALKVISIGSYGLDNRYVDQGIRAISNTITQSRIINKNELAMVLNDKTANGSIIGRTLLIQRDREYVANQRTEIIHPKDMLDSGFTYFALNGIFRNSVKKIVQGGTQIYVNFSAIALLPLKIPTLSEQKKIQDFFKILTHLIAATQRRISALEEIKEALSQYLFVQKWRFRGYSNPWKRVVLGEIADIIGGGTPKTDEPKFWNGEIDWYAPAEIGSNRYVAGSVRTITSVGLNKSSASILPANRTILFTSRAGIGNAAILKKDAATNQGFQSLVLKDGVDIYFIYSRIPEIKQKAIRIAAGSTFLEISGKKLSQIALLVPELNEQQKIGAFLKKLDDLVAANHSKVSRLNLLKKFQLQGLFI